MYYYYYYYYLGNAQAGNGESSDEIPLELVQVVAPPPVEDGEERPEAQNYLLPLGLILERAQGVVVEERLLHRLFELAQKPPAGGEAHLVDRFSILVLEL